MVLTEEKRRIRNILEVQSDLFTLSTEELEMKYGSTEGSINFIDGLNGIINVCSFSYFFDYLDEKISRVLQASWLNTLVDPRIDRETQNRIEFECQRLFLYKKKNDAEKEEDPRYYVDMKGQYEGIRCSTYGLSGTTHKLPELLKSMPVLFDAIVTGHYQAADSWYANGVAYLANNYPEFMDSLSDGKKADINRILDRKTIRRCSDFFGPAEEKELRKAARAARKELRSIPKKLEKNKEKSM